MTDKLPPFNAEAEDSVVASLLVDRSALDAITGIVQEQDFYRDQNRWAFAACKALWERGETVNQVTVLHELTRAEQLPPNGAAWLSQIVGDLPTPVGVEHYAGIVHRDARYRRAISAASHIVARAYAGGPDLDGFLTDTESVVAALRDDEIDSSGFVSVSKMADEYWDMPPITARETGLFRTGITDLDKILAGVMPGNLVVVAAQTGHGKSTLLLNFARNAAVGQNFRVAILSLEMSRDEWFRRLLARETRIPIDRLRDGSERNERKAQEQTAVIHGWSIQVYDRPQMSIDSIRASLRRLAHKLGGLDLVLVDYLQLIGSTRRFDNRTAEVGAISRGLKLIAKELNVPVIAAAQLSRETDKRSPPIPRLSDLRESGAIEQDADAVVFMYRPDKVVSAKELAENTSIPRGIVELIVAKHRNGPTGSAYARIDDATARVTDMNEREQEESWVQ